MAKAPRQVARAKENKENIIEELHAGAWHTELLRECTQGSLVPLVQWAKDLNKPQRYLSRHWRVNCAKLEFHPSIKQHHVLQIIFFSDQGGSWHCIHLQGCKCCAAALDVEIWAKKGQITSTAWKCNSGTLLLQLQQSHPCDWQDQGGFQDKQDYHCMVAGIRKAELTWHSRPGWPWAYLGSELIGVVVQSPSERLLKWQLYVCEGLCGISKTANTILC